MLWLAIIFSVIVLAFSAPFIYSVFEYTMPNFNDPITKMIISGLPAGFAFVYFYFLIMRE